MNRAAAHDERRDAVSTATFDAEVRRAPDDVQHDDADPDGERDWRGDGSSRGDAPRMRCRRIVAARRPLALVEIGQVARRVAGGPSGRGLDRRRAADLARPVALRAGLAERAERDPVAVLDPARVAARRPAHDLRRRPSRTARSPRRAASSRPSGSRPSAARIVRLLRGPAERVLADRAVRPDDAVARHDERHRVVAERRPDGADRLRPADLRRDPAVRPDLAARDLERLAPDVELELGAAAQVERDPDPPARRRVAG